MTTPSIKIKWDTQHDIMLTNCNYYHYADCHYGECCCTECRGATLNGDPLLYRVSVNGDHRRKLKNFFYPNWNNLDRLSHKNLFQAYCLTKEL
jgi:hypothetical protein